MIWWLSTPPRGDTGTGVGTGELLGQVNLTTTNNNDTTDGPGVAGWSQAQVDVVFYALVADLAGAPQELIDTEQLTLSRGLLWGM